MVIDHPTYPAEIRIEADIRKPTYIQSLRGHRDRESKNCIEEKANQSFDARSSGEPLTSKNQDRRKRYRAREQDPQLRKHAFSCGSKCSWKRRAGRYPEGYSWIRTADPYPGECKKTHRAVPCPAKCKRTRRAGRCLGECSWTRTADPCPGGCMERRKVDLCPF
jgi:hypothetical protein